MTLLLCLIFLTVTTLSLAVARALAPDPLRARLDRLRTAEGTARSEDPQGILLEDSPGAAARLLATLGRRSSPESTSRTRQRLIMAGWRKPSTLHVYLGGRVALAALLPLAVLNSPLSYLEPLRLAVLLALGAAVGLVLPSMLLDRRVAARQREIEQSLPDALDVMVVCVEAGLGLNASIARVAAEYANARPVLAEEFELVTLEARAGRSNVEALRGLGERTGVAEVSALVAMLVQTERFGTSIADALRIHAAAMRQRRMQRAEEGAAKAPLKMLFPAGVFIFPATLLVIAGPGLIRLIAALQGN